MMAQPEIIFEDTAFVKIINHIIDMNNSAQMQNISVSTEDY